MSLEPENGSKTFTLVILDDFKHKMQLLFGENTKSTLGAITYPFLCTQILGKTMQILLKWFQNLTFQMEMVIIDSNQKKKSQT